MTTASVITIAAVSLLLGGGAGFVMHRSDFCIVAAFRNYFLFRQAFMLRMLLLLVCATMVLFEACRLVGLLRSYPFPLLGSPSLANLGGGFLFGVGMVLAGGCVIGTLYRMGSGSCASLVAFAGLVLGSTLYGEIHPWWSGVALSGAFFPGATTLSQSLGVDPLVPALPVVAVGLLVLQRWQRAGLLRRRSSAQGYLQPIAAALALSCIGTLSYLTIGMPLGVTTAYAKIGAYVERLVVPAHLAELGYFRSMPLSSVAPLGGIHLTGGPGPALDGIALIQFPLIVGITAGAAVSAALLGELRFHARIPARQYLSALAGGTIMGLAARMAPACSVWHLFGGLPLLAWQSILFAIGLVPGAWLGSRLFILLVVPNAGPMGVGR